MIIVAWNFCSNKLLSLNINCSSLKLIQLKVYILVEIFKIISFLKAVIFLFSFRFIKNTCSCNAD